MSFRYSYTATMKTGDTVNENGDPIEGIPVSFPCDYQPNVSNTTINYSGSFVNISYRLFVDKNSGIVFPFGTEVSCNGTKGIIVNVCYTKLNTEIWVK